MSKILDSSNFISADASLCWCDSVFYSDALAASGKRGSFAPGDIVFCKIDEVLNFFEVLRLTRKRVVLVTGEGDYPCDAFRQKFLPANVSHWFATNVVACNARVTALPLGLGPRGDAATLSEAELAAMQDLGIQRDKWLLVNFRPETNPTVRQPVFEHFREMAKTMDWISVNDPTERGSNHGFLDQLVRHRFVLCPPGNGVDTHRFWETLATGGIPIALRSVVMEPFAGLRALFVDDFREVTLERLQNTWAELADSQRAVELTHACYWEAMVRKAADATRVFPRMSMANWVGESLKYGVAMAGRRLGFGST